MKDLICTIYKSSREEELYLYVEKDTELSTVPDELLKRMGKAREVMTILLNAEKKLARVQASIVLQDIEEKGYFLQLPPEFNPHLTYGE